MSLAECRGRHFLFVTDYEKDRSVNFKLVMFVTTVIDRHIVIVFLTQPLLCVCVFYSVEIM